MRKLALAALVAALVVALLPTGSSASRGPRERREGAGHRIKTTGRFVPGQVIVGFHSAQGAARVLKESGSPVNKKLAGKRTRLVMLPEGQSVDRAIARFQSLEEVEFAEPDYLYELRATVPNDPLFTQMWGLDNSGQTVAGVTGTVDADIDAPEAWDVETGSDEVLVAVVDDGADIDHPDLAANYVNGYDYGDDDLDPRPSAGNTHGTHTAGTVAAQGNDGIGVTGVAWDAGLMIFKVSNSEGELRTSAIVDAFDAAGEAGAKVVNASLGGPFINRSMVNAISRHPETLYVVASGNSGQNVDKRPDGPCDVWTLNVICVGATGPFDEPLSFSNIGDVNVDLSAPGINILSTQPFSVPLKTQLFDYPIEGRWLTGGTNNDWGVEPPETFGYSLLADSPGVPYEPNTDSWAQYAQAIDLSDEEACQLEWYMQVDIRKDHAQIKTELSHDAVTWETVGSHGGYADAFFAEDLADYIGDDSVYVRFRLETDSATSKGRPGVFMDSQKVTCYDTPYGPQHYDMFVGTSMASPHVAGAATLLFSNVPDATVEQVRWALLESVDDIEGSDGLTATDGRLNVATALALLGVAPEDPFPDTGAITHDIKIKAISITRFRKKIDAFAAFAPKDGHWACSVNRDFDVQVLTEGGWETVDSGTSEPDGFVSARFDYVPGSYRFSAPASSVDDSIDCSKKVSKTVVVE